MLIAGDTPQKLVMCDKLSQWVPTVFLNAIIRREIEIIRNFIRPERFDLWFLFLETLENKLRSLNGLQEDVAQKIRLINEDQ